MAGPPPGNPGLGCCGNNLASSAGGAKISRITCPVTFAPCGKIGVLPLILALAGVVDVGGAPGKTGEAAKFTAGSDAGANIAGPCEAKNGESAGLVRNKASPTAATPNNTMIRSRFCLDPFVGKTPSCSFIQLQKLFGFVSGSYFTVIL